MIEFGELMTRVGTPGNWREAIADVRAEHGRGARRWLAAEFGVHPDTAGRWLSGKQAPGGRAGTRKARDLQARIVGAVAPHRAAARYIRTATRLDIGEIDLDASSYGGTRNVGGFDVTPRMRDQLDRVADALERGNTQDAAGRFGDLVLDAYFSKGNVGARHRQSDMGIAGYGDNATILGE